MNQPKNRYNAQRVAYELWCIEQDRLDTRQLVGGLGPLISVLRERHPRLKEAVIDRAVGLFLDRLFEDHQARVTRHQAWILQASLPLIRAPRGLGGDGCVCSRSSSDPTRGLHESENISL